MSEPDLGCSADWVLKGEGNASAVFGYFGADISLVSSPGSSVDHVAHDECQVRPC